VNERIKIPPKLHHVAVLVEDIENAVEKIKKIFDVGDIKVIEDESIAVINGKEVGKYKLKMAFFYFGEVLIELLEIPEGYSVELDWLKKHGRVIHHFCFEVEDMYKEAEKWAKMGIRLLQTDHGKWIYLDTEDLLGFIIELEPTEQIQKELKLSGIIKK
jgi:4-hydroxyphenylpyruvate dioxygenase-like putative hemolysin